MAENPEKGKEQERVNEEALTKGDEDHKEKGKEKEEALKKDDEDQTLSKEKGKEKERVNEEEALKKDDEDQTLGKEKGKEKERGNEEALIKGDEDQTLSKEKGKEKESVNEEEALKKGDEDKTLIKDKGKEKERGNEEALKKGDEDQTASKQKEKKIDQQTSKPKNRKPLPVFKTPPTPIPVKTVTADELWWREATKDLPLQGRKLVVFLRTLPVYTSDSEDAKLVSAILSLVMDLSYLRPLFAHKWGINQVLNPVSIQRSWSDDTLQAFMVQFVLFVSSFENKLFVHDCPGAMPFLIVCLGSNTPETRHFAATALAWLSLEGSNRKKMGESLVIGQLVELIRKEDTDQTVCLSRAACTLYNLCKEAENRERAVSHGAVAVVVDKIRSRVCMARMLGTLEMLSRHEKAIAQLMENGMLMLKELLVMLGEEDLTEEGMEYCITIIHTACGANAVKLRELVDGAKDGRETLDHVVNSGTEKARKIAGELILKVILLDNEQSKNLGSK